MKALNNPDYLKQLALNYDLRPSRQYGQNYLIDESVIDKIVQIAKLKPTDTVVEIGPGFGILTFPVAKKVQMVTSYEIEKKLLPYWEKSRPENVEIVWGNFLKQFHAPGVEYKVVANLPYQITSAAIRTFLESEHPPREMVLMVQKEVGERICAAPGEMSLLSVSVQYYGEASFEINVPRSSFWPSPEVDSAVVRIIYKNTGRDLKYEADFFRMVKIGFANRRKFLIKNLEAYIGKAHKGKLQKIFSEMNLSLKVRAQELSVEEWKELYKNLSS